MRRFGEPEEIAAAIVFSLSDEAAFMTLQTKLCDRIARKDLLRLRSSLRTPEFERPYLSRKARDHVARGRLDDHAPADHMLRGIDRHLELDSARAHLKPFYSNSGRPSMPAARLAGYCIIGTAGIRRPTINPGARQIGGRRSRLINARARSADIFCRDGVCMVSSRVDMRARGVV